HRCAPQRHHVAILDRGDDVNRLWRTGRSGNRLAAYAAGEIDNAFLCSMVGASDGILRQRGHWHDLRIVAGVESRATRPDRIAAVRVSVRSSTFTRRSSPPATQNSKLRLP